MFGVARLVFLHLLEDLAAALVGFRQGLQMRVEVRGIGGCAVVPEHAAEAFEARAVEKVYLGVVAGVLSDDEGAIELALAKISSAADSLIGSSYR